MRDFFAGITGYWPAGVGHCHWHVLPDPEIIRRQLAGPYQELTHRTGLDSVQSRWSHITVQHFAPLGRPADDAMGKIMQLVRDRCSRIALFQAVIGEARVQAAGIVCPVRAGPSLRQLWQAATGAGRNVTGKRYEVRPDPYDPRLRLAYACADVNDKPLQEWRSSCRIGTVAIPVTRLSLMAQRHDCKEITWRLLEHIPLSGKPR